MFSSGKKTKFGSDAPNPFRILKLSLWTSTMRGIISGPTLWVYWGGINERKPVKHLAVSLTQTKCYLLLQSYH